VIYVCSNGNYVGYLYCTSADPDGSTFTGTISSNASTSHPLQFIYLGGDTRGANRDSKFRSNTTGSFTFSLEDQSYVLHVVSTAASKETFDPAATSYTLAGGKMRNKCALVKFTFKVDDSDLSSAEEVSITGVYNQLNIGFDGTVEIVGDRGDISTFRSTSNAVRYAVVPAGQDLSGIIEIEGYEGTYSIDAPDYNGFIQETVTLTPEPESGFAEKEFTIDAQGTTVYFSRSNAHFDPTNSPTPRWYFADNQYDYEGTWHSNEPVSHFAWGTWSDYSNPNIPNVEGILTYDYYSNLYQLNPNGSFY
jgi:hypothetical protein